MTTRRPGLSLTEVLVALFIMALGTIAILTMFPLGALQMGQALKDDRTAQSAGAADAYLRWYWKTFVVETGGGAAEPFVQALENPNAGVPTANAKPTCPPLAKAEVGPSYPVVVDPMGWVARAGDQTNRLWVGGQNLPRRTLAQLYDLQPAAHRSSLAQRTCSLLDGFGYAPDGTPSTASGAVERELRYNWLWVIQQPSHRDKLVANMTVVVFDKRAHLYVPPNAEQVFVPSVATIGETRLQFATFPQVQKGGWIADVTTTTVGSGASLASGVRNCNFYRVVSVTENTPGVFDVELQTPLKPDSKSVGAPDALPAQRRFLVLYGASEVFTRPPLTAASFGP